MTKFHAAFPNFMQNLLIYWQLGSMDCVVPKLGVLGNVKISRTVAAQAFSIFDRNKVRFGITECYHLFIADWTTATLYRLEQLMPRLVNFISPVWRCVRYLRPAAGVIEKRHQMLLMDACCCRQHSQTAELARPHLCGFARHGSNLADCGGRGSFFVGWNSLQSVVVEVFMLSNCTLLSYLLL